MAPKGQSNTCSKGYESDINDDDAVIERYQVGFFVVVGLMHQWSFFEVHNKRTFVVEQ